jgi:TniQ
VTTPRHHAPIHRLPVRPRPVGGELASSYLRRLAEANHAKPRDIAQAIGHTTGTNLGGRTSRIVTTNPALHRWATLAGTTPQRLTAALTHLDVLNGQPVALLHFQPEPAHRTWWRSRQDTCPRCRARHGGALELAAPGSPLELVCRRHRLWIAASEAHLWLNPFEHPELDRAYRTLTTIRHHRQPDHILAAWQWALLYLHEWASSLDHRQLTARWSKRITDTHVSRRDLAGTWPVFAMLPELVAITALFSDSTWTTSAIPQPDGGHRPAYLPLWRALYPDGDSEPTTLLQFGTLSRHLADIEPQQAICDHAPADYRQSTHTQVTWDLDGRRVAVRRR